jgi:hypothetical protein
MRGLPVVTWRARILVGSLLMVLAMPVLCGARSVRFAPTQLIPSGIDQPKCIATADLNHDGYPDLVATGYSDNLNVDVMSVLLNRGDGTFNPPTTYTFDFYVIGCLAVADFNSDGHPDILIVGGDVSGNGIALFTGDGKGNFTGPIYTPTLLAGASLSVAVGDLNKDGADDLFVGGNGSSETVFGDGSGHFQDGTFQGAFGFDVILGDFNADGSLDAATAGGTSDDLFVLLGNGDGSFQNPDVYANLGVPDGVASGDFNHDGKLDLAVSLYQDSVIETFVGNGDGTFSVGQLGFVGTYPGKLIAADFNKDGNLDLAVANFGSNNVAVLPGQADGSFPTTQFYTTGSSPAYVASGDFNQDGSLDLAVSDYGDGTIALLPNAGGTFVRLSSSPNPSKVGEPVTFTATVVSSLDSKYKGSGSVTFSSHSQHTVPIRLINGVATFTTAKLPEGTFHVIAEYSGDNSFNPNTSKPLTQKVAP